MIEAMIQAADERAVVDRLPPVARALVPALGLARVVELCREHGGRRLYVALKPTAKTAEWLSHDEHLAVLRFVGAGHIDVPLLQAHALAARNAQLLRDFDAGMAMEALVGRYRLTSRTIRKLCHAAA